MIGRFLLCREGPVRSYLVSLAARVVRGRRGQTAVEYALVLAFVVIGLVAALYAAMPVVEDGVSVLVRNAYYWLRGP